MATRQKGKQVPGNRFSPLGLAFSLNVLLACFVFLPTVNSNARLVWSVLGAAGTLLVLLFFLRREVISTGRTLRYEVLAKPVHYVQLTMHTCIYAYWGR